MSLAARLRSLRIQKGKSLQQVADEVGASKAHIWDLEQGRSKNPSIDLLKGISKSLGVSIADLVGENPQGEGEDPKLVAMYRDLKELDPEDREAIQKMMDHLKSRQAHDE